jgi:hypothetical protein
MKHTIKTFILPLLLLVSAVAVLALTAANKTGHFRVGVRFGANGTIGVVVPPLRTLPRAWIAFLE